ncbi:AfsR/SARP family transcriptional regulator [Kineococcus rhizosphaerae]|uniref:AfsR/SARP family transcriptional regulator n=1 Tax=Kineococcus rhizosphaerae TaxID=559628 RepID=UPI001473AB38|nr:bacterial transcriptional activator domain-containing protein [Kineococcus rhizosphaerae]
MSRKSWAVLARVLVGDRPPSRRDLAEELFGTADDPLAALRWSLAELRRALEAPDALRGDPPGVPPDLACDAADLDAGTLPDDDLGGTLLEGVEVRDCPGFDAWLLLARARCAARTREELHSRAVAALGRDDVDAALPLATRAAALDVLDEEAQELLVRALVAAGLPAQALAHLGACEARLVRAGITPSPALRDAARTAVPVRPAVRSAAAARALLAAGVAACGAGAPDAGVGTLRQALAEARGSGDAGLQAGALLELGRALVHAVRGADGEGALVLHQALRAAATAGRPDLASDVLRESGFVDVQAGRHRSAARALARALRQAGDDGRRAAVLAMQGMNSADQGRHRQAVDLLRESARLAATVGDDRQRSWSLGVLARSALLSGDAEQARRAARTSLHLARRQSWTAFVPWPQVIAAQAVAAIQGWAAVGEELEEAFAAACSLGDPCWEGMAARALGVAALHRGQHELAASWVADARRRCDRVPDRYVWVSAYVGLAEVEVAAAGGRGAVLVAARRLEEQAVRADLPEFVAWALVHQVEAGDRDRRDLARDCARGVEDPALLARAAALGDDGSGPGGARRGNKTSLDALNPVQGR